ncbi:unnamed protein product [Nippostrongylus brasiliensis]|uniref:Uncharacterized protein n=1 Tax=Nippostrongylus brasiliensis TaxID=27835 RepID=A0A0N4XQX9_NIPBR|nr:unnamed protein product [Nippostrongylus brasiliensis]
MPQASYPHASDDELPVASCHLMRLGEARCVSRTSEASCTPSPVLKDVVSAYQIFLTFCSTGYKEA